MAPLPDMSQYLMVDDVDLAAEEPYVADAAAVAGYVNGKYDNWPAIVQKYGGNGKHLVSIDVQANPAAGAQCLDIERFDATPQQAPGWHKTTAAAGAHYKDLRFYPKLYCSAGVMMTLIGIMNAAGIPRDSYLIWSAHYTGQPHVCGPTTCGYPQADATQWTSRYKGASVDASLCYGYFFAGPGDAVAPHDLILTPGTKDAANVRILQAVLNGLRADGLAVDGVYGDKTKGAVEDFQGFMQITVDGICGPVTEMALVSRVERLQAELNKHGAALKVDGVLGNATIASLEAFQKAHGLPATGDADLETWKALVAPVTPPPPPPVPLPVQLWVQLVLSGDQAKTHGFPDGTVCWIPSLKEAA